MGRTLVHDGLMPHLNQRPSRRKTPLHSPRHTGMADNVTALLWLLQLPEVVDNLADRLAALKHHPPYRHRPGAMGQDIAGAVNEFGHLLTGKHPLMLPRQPCQ